MWRYIGYFHLEYRSIYRPHGDILAHIGPNQYMVKLYTYRIVFNKIPIYRPIYWTNIRVYQPIFKTVRSIDGMELYERKKRPLKHIALGMLTLNTLEDEMGNLAISLFSLSRRLLLAIHSPSNYITLHPG